MLISIFCKLSCCILLWVGAVHRVLWGSFDFIYFLDWYTRFGNRIMYNLLMCIDLYISVGYQIVCLWWKWNDREDLTAVLYLFEVPYFNGGKCLNSCIPTASVSVSVSSLCFILWTLFARKLTVSRRTVNHFFAWFLECRTLLVPKLTVSYKGLGRC